MRIREWVLESFVILAVEQSICFQTVFSAFYRLLFQVLDFLA